MRGIFCVVGADGFLGSYFIRHIMQNSDEKIIALNHKEAAFPDSEQLTNMIFELSDEESIKKAAALLSGFRDIRILFLASVHNPDIIKKDPDNALYINTVCYNRFLESIKDLDVKKLYYASSDTVYGESIDGYSFTENDTPAPVNIYGEQKLGAERITLEHGFSVIRYSALCGVSLTSRKNHFCDMVVNSVSEGKEFFLLTDWRRPALSYKDAADITYRLFSKDIKEKIINICSDRIYSKYEIGIKLCEHGNFNKQLLIPATKEELGVFTEKRADDIYMDNSLIKSLLRIDSLELKF